MFPVGCGWTFPVLNEGLFAAVKCSHWDIVKYFNGDGNHWRSALFLLAFKEKTPKRCDTWHLLKSEMCHLARLERAAEVGEVLRSSQVLVEVPAPSARFIQKPEQKCFAFHRALSPTVTAVYFCLAACICSAG